MTRGDAPANGGKRELRVDLAPDRRDRIVWVVFLAGPVIWFTHFMLVYLVAEAGCTGDGPGLSLFDPPVTAVFTIWATAVAAIAALAAAAWGYRRWRRGGGDRDDAGSDAGDGDRRHRDLALGGALLAGLSFVTIVGVGIPAAFLPPC